MDQPPSPTARPAAASQLLISAGLPKSGSTWLHNLQDALGEAAGWGRWQAVARFEGGRGVATFNKGGTGRFRTAFTDREIAGLNDRFARFMRATGYPPDPAGEFPRH